MRYMTTMFFGLFILLLTCGCSTLGNTSAAQPKNPHTLWEEGQKQVSAGESMVARGEKKLAEGRETVREGEEMIDKGNQRMLQARRDYQAAAHAIGGSTNPEQVTTEANRLKNIGERWEDAIDSVKAGNKRIKKGNNLIMKAQQQISEGRQLIESGSIMMRDSQRSQLGVGLLMATPQTDTGADIY